MTSQRLLLSIVEAGGYPNFSPLYEQAGFEVIAQSSMRQTLRWLKNNTPAVIIAEFNFQSDFRDRTSSLETLMSVVSRRSEIKTVIFFDREYHQQFERLKSRFVFDHELSFPIDREHLSVLLQSISKQA